MTPFLKKAYFSKFSTALQEMWIGVPFPPVFVPLGKAEAEARLKEKIPGLFVGFMAEGLRGSVRNGKVALCWNTPGFGNAWRPVLHGKIVGDDRASRVEGVFSTFRFTQVFCVVWFGGLLVFAVVGLVTVIFSLFGLLMIAFGVGLVALGQHLSRNEKEKIIAAIRELR